jgi:hypothetical protein
MGLSERRVPCGGEPRRAGALAQAIGALPPHPDRLRGGEHRAGLGELPMNCACRSAVHPSPRGRMGTGWNGGMRRRRYCLGMTVSIDEDGADLPLVGKWFVGAAGCCHFRFMTRIAALFALLFGLAGCVSTPPADPHDAFWRALASHCGKVYAGRLVSDEASDAAMRGAAMAMHVRECSPARIAVPFHVRQADGAWNRSRTWVFTRTAQGIRLKHDHRHEDGSSDKVTMYGGDTAGVGGFGGTARAQDFPVDAESVALFRREGLDVSVTNVWRVEVDPAGTPGARFAYQLTRPAPNARTFRVEFDLTRPVPPPPAPWGW